MKYIYISLLIIITLTNCSKDIEIISPFTFEAKSNQTVYYLNTPAPITTTIIKVNAKEGEKFNLKYSIDNGDGDLYYGDEKITINRDYKINSGRNVFHYVAKDIGLGEHNINMEVTDSGNNVRSQKLALNIKKGNISFEATPEKNSIFIGEVTNLNMNINTNETTNTLKIRYEIKGTSEREIIADGEPLSPGIYKPVNSGFLSWQLKGLKSGTTSIKLFLENDTGILATKELSVIINSSTFEYSVKSNSIDIIPTSDNIISHLIENISGDQKLEYSYSILNGSGQMKRNNVVQNPNVWYSIEPSEFKETVFKASNIENSNVNIEFNIKNNYGVLKTVQISFNLLYVSISKITTSMPQYSSENNRRGWLTVCMKGGVNATKLKVIGINPDKTYYDGNFISSYHNDMMSCTGSCGPKTIKIEVTYPTGVVEVIRNVDTWSAIPEEKYCN